ncbi:hypothetical protein L208DRAFT_1274443 [Tricholoma matsutake]|nr:hypothetical protein L208DRAFT_1274443 [Tricholoma matsutake 945]
MMHSKTGGKNGKHTWVLSTTHVTSVSYLPMQVYKHMHSRQFHAVPCMLQHLHVKIFALLPSSSFLCTLNSIRKTWRYRYNQMGIAKPSKFDRCK